MTKRTKEKAVAKYEVPTTADGRAVARAYGVAHFLAWAHKSRPGDAFFCNEIAKEVMRLPKLPSKEGKDAELIRSVMSRAREVLLSEFGLSSLYDKENGYRACISSEEAVKEDLIPRIRRRVRLDQRIRTIADRGINIAELGRDSASIVRKARRASAAELTDELLNDIKKLAGPST